MLRMEAGGVINAIVFTDNPISRQVLEVNFQLHGIDI